MTHSIDLSEVLKKAAVILALSVLLSMFGPCLAAQSVVIVMDTGHQSRQTANSIQRTLNHKKPGIVVEQLLLGDDRELTEDIIQAIQAESTKVVIPIGNRAVNQVLSTTRTKPVVSGMIFDADILVGHPNATGLISQYSLNKRSQLFKKIFPDAKVLGVITIAGTKTRFLEQVELYGQKFGVEVFNVQVRSKREMPNAINTVLKKSDVFMVFPEVGLWNTLTAKALLLESFRQRVPVIGLSQSWVKAGALYGSVWDSNSIGEHLAEMSLKVLQGTPVKNIPVRQLDGLRYCLNQKTANSLSITIPKEIFEQADKVFR